MTDLFKHQMLKTVPNFLNLHMHINELRRKQTTKVLRVRIVNRIFCFVFQNPVAYNNYFIKQLGRKTRDISEAGYSWDFAGRVCSEP